MTAIYGKRLNADYQLIPLMHQIPGSN